MKIVNQPIDSKGSHWSDRVSMRQICLVRAVAVSRQDKLKLLLMLAERVIRD